MYVDSDEDVVEGHIVGGANNGKVLEGNGGDDEDIEDDGAGAAMANYDQQNEEDDANAYSNARDVRIPFNKEDIKLWFSLIESKMQFVGVK